MDDEDRDLKHSPLSDMFNRDGEAIAVEIFRYAGTQDSWPLNVVDLSSGGCTAWHNTFATDQDAHAAFVAMVDASGISDFVGRKPETRH